MQIKFPLLFDRKLLWLRLFINQFKYNKHRMKKYLLPLFVMAYSLNYSQVGINTSNPQGIFNIDGKKTTMPRAALQQYNRLMIL
jgi:hypothetical protein